MRSPEMAPQAAMAADTPQIDTAVAIMAENSSSTRSLRATQKHRYQMTAMTAAACTIPYMPASSTRPNRTLEPRITSPALM